MSAWLAHVGRPCGCFMLGGSLSHRDSALQQPLRLLALSLPHRAGPPGADVLALLWSPSRQLAAFGTSAADPLTRPASRPHASHSLTPLCMLLPTARQGLATAGAEAPSAEVQDRLCLQTSAAASTLLSTGQKALVMHGKWVPKLTDPDPSALAGRPHCCLPDANGGCVPLQIENPVT